MAKIPADAREQRPAAQGVSRCAGESAHRVDCIDPAEPTPGQVPPATSATRTIVAANRAVERGREIDQPQELGAVSIRVGATMLLGERTC
jgi:hypothetical protein